MMSKKEMKLLSDMTISPMVEKLLEDLLELIEDKTLTGATGGLSDKIKEVVEDSLINQYDVYIAQGGSYDQYHWYEYYGKEYVKSLEKYKGVDDE
jgi:hypothetical protein